MIEHCPKAKIILVGTKKDLRSNEEISKKSLIIPEDGEKLASTINAEKYLECSSLNQDGLLNLFEEAVKSVIGFPKLENNTENSHHKTDHKHPHKVDDEINNQTHPKKEHKKHHFCVLI